VLKLPKFLDSAERSSLLASLLPEVHIFSKVSFFLQDVKFIMIRNRCETLYYQNFNELLPVTH